MTKQPTFKLYGHPMSSNTRRAQLVFAHLGVPYELVLIDLMSQEDRARLRRINPNEKVPVLEHGDFVLWESHAIMQYVAQLTPGQALYPYAVRERADVDRWLFWHNQHLAPPLSGLGWERMWKKKVTGGDPDPGQIERNEWLWSIAAKVLDGHLARRTWLAGDAVSLADLSVAASLANAPMYGVDLAPYAHVRAHAARVAQLPAWAATQPAPFVPPPQATAAPRPRVG